MENDRQRSNTARKSKHIRYWNKIELREVPSSYNHLRPRFVFVELREHIIDFLLRLRNNARPSKRADWIFGCRDTQIAVRTPSNIAKKSRKIIPAYAIQRCHEVQFDNDANHEVMRVISRVSKMAKYLKRTAINYQDKPSNPYVNILRSPQVRFLLRKTLIYSTPTSDELSIRGGPYTRLAYTNSKQISSEEKLNESENGADIEALRTILGFISIFRGVKLSDRVLKKIKNIKVLALEFCHSGKYFRDYEDLDDVEKITSGKKFESLCSAMTKFLTLESLSLVIEGTTGCFKNFEGFTQTVALLKQLKKLDLMFVRPSSDFTDFLGQLANVKPFTSAEHLTTKLKFEEDSDLISTISLLPKSRSKGISAFFEISFEFYFQSEIALAFEQENSNYCLAKFGSKLPKYNRLLNKFYSNKIDVTDISIKVDLTIDFNATSLLTDLDRLSNYCKNLRRLKLEILHTLGVLPPQCNAWLNSLKNLSLLSELDISLPEIRSQEPAHLLLARDTIPKPIKILVEHMENLKSLKNFQLKFEGKFFGCQHLNSLAEVLGRSETFERLTIIAGCVFEHEGEHLLDLMTSDKKLQLVELKLLNINKLFNDKTEMSNFLANPWKVFEALDGCLELFRNATLKLVFIAPQVNVENKKVLSFKRSKNRLEAPIMKTEVPNKTTEP